MEGGISGKNVENTTLDDRNHFLCVTREAVCTLVKRNSPVIEHRTYPDSRQYFINCKCPAGKRGVIICYKPPEFTKELKLQTELSYLLTQSASQRRRMAWATWATAHGLAV
ncbi:hypothetical protein MSG28_003268 [Choristoneura fumiferana]|uniref:Uncharacterized protein n=1 Tax=Choristoneura fumiferana TaxID=7141 RepID=A0ACC0KF57_CHOFU|nr:hypothetical protein MSG28_003268 [Choristoneura fumiferana]